MPMLAPRFSLGIQMAFSRTPFLPTAALGLLLVAGLALPASGAMAGPDDGMTRLAQFDDPRLPSYVKPSRSRRTIRSQPRPAPFALPTSPIATPRASPSSEGERPEIPGENELPPYGPELLRLAEILGAVHYLRQLCDADEGQTWRTMMQQLIDAENPSPERRAKLVDSFNRGYRGFEQSYRSCTETAVWVINNYMA